MKQLTIVRHAKSSWEHEVQDKDRPLKDRGINDALLVSSHVRDRMEMPDMVFSSPANRALHTCTIFMRTLGIPWDKLRLSDELYDFSGASVGRFVKAVDDNYDKIMIFGHNHALTTVSNNFGDLFTDNVPTSGLVRITFGVERWSDIRDGKTDLMVFPKHLR
ncbi:SixA phosphatase family protein [Sinomicrobium soli]|uniref:SixA phosphatase family protein n=1 Tax=Sinomicrobium sp. N-1-3-6 TaxID=2219864 RepID=UPI000DCB503D|nr:histidine phosphatase family protein [Sinomicrobium sp. N-1-3-6]RAV28609.1 histidine phosphatase family protein [Sinomicrobium sp. N-1-3-6]